MNSGASDPPIDPDLDPADPAQPQFPIDPARPAPIPFRRNNPVTLACVALGGMTGTVLRALLGRIAPTPSGHFPFTTLGINLTGSFVLGVLIAGVFERSTINGRWRPFLATGVLGGYTTFSTFLVEATQLGRHGRVGTATLYVVVSLFGGVAAAWLGILLGKSISPVAPDAPHSTRPGKLAP